ncbi:MAG: uroporphyrinogen decarboxylase [Deltaproteobacteria bacterium]|nr:uroporphyrinogen decarboxylase [Deltaproteobacteria bacterium]
MDFLNALQNKATSKTPIWLMRQAGRYMACYRELRAKHSLLELVKTPELACEITLQPIKAFNLDAAIIFSDILPILETLGLKLEFIKGEGPALHDPIRSANQVEQLDLRPLEETIGFTLEAIKLVKPELKVPLIGFSGSPFTLACYAIEGGGSKDHRLAKTFMYEHPDAWHKLMDILATLIGKYLRLQAEAGADVLQIFDSWAGSLGPQDYKRFVFPHTQKVIQMLGSDFPPLKKGGQGGFSRPPIIYFSTGTSAYLDIISKLDADAFSIDWRVSLKQAAQVFQKPIQGNLDPIALLAPWPELKHQVDLILEQAPKTGFVFNLGHGILQFTPEDNVKRLTDYLTSLSNRVIV